MIRVGNDDTSLTSKGPIEGKTEPHRSPIRDIEQGGSQRVRIVQEGCNPGSFKLTDGVQGKFRKPENSTRTF